MKRFFSIALILMFSLSSRAAIMSGTFTNAYGEADTNSFLLIPLESAVARADGTFRTAGLPRRIRPNSSGYWETNLMVGNWMASNAAISPGIVFRVPEDSGDTVYSVWSNRISGFNTFVTVQYGTNPPPTYDQLTNALGFVPIPKEATNNLATVPQLTATNTALLEVIQNSTNDLAEAIPGIVVDNAVHASSADSATLSTHATTADSASNATNLNGLSASAYLKTNANASLAEVTAGTNDSKFLTPLVAFQKRDQEIAESRLKRSTEILTFRGIDSYYSNSGTNNGFVTEYWCHAIATNLINTGLFAAGWNTIQIADGWWLGRDTNTFKLMEDTNWFPNGVSNTIQTLHNMGFKVVLYYDDKTPYGVNTNHFSPQYDVFRNPDGTVYNGIIDDRYYSNDVCTFRDWKIDGLAWDSRLGLDDSIARRQHEGWSKWLSLIAPNIAYFSYGSSLKSVDWVVATPENIGTSWHSLAFTNAHKLPRWRPNVSDVSFLFFDPVSGVPEWQQLMFELSWAEQASGFISPSHTICLGGIWNEGNPAWSASAGVAASNAKASMGFWSLYHSPFLLSGNAFAVYSGVRHYLTNATALRIQRDPLMNPPRKIFDDGTGGQIWKEALADGSVAVMFINQTNLVTKDFALSCSQFGFSSNKLVKVERVFSYTNSLAMDSFAWSVPTNDCDLFVFSDSVKTDYVDSERWLLDSSWTGRINYTVNSPSPYFGINGAYTTGGSTPKLNFRVPDDVKTARITTVWHTLGTQWFTNTWYPKYFDGSNFGGSIPGTPEVVQGIAGLVTNTFTVQWPVQTSLQKNIGVVVGASTNTSQNRYLLNVTVNYY